jgi:hypothetical protein
MSASKAVVEMEEGIPCAMVGRDCVSWVQGEPVLKLVLRDKNAKVLRRRGEERRGNIFSGHEHENISSPHLHAMPPDYDMPRHQPQLSWRFPRESAASAPWFGFNCKWDDKVA